MGPSPPPAAAPPTPPSQLSPSHPPSSLPNLLSAADDWFLNASDRDTQILTQALMRELSSCSRGPAPARSSSSSLFPSPITPASFPSSSSSFGTLSCLDGRPLQSQSFETLRALQQQQQQQQQQLNHLQHQQKAVAMSSMQPHGDGFSHLEQIPQQKGSPLSSNSSPPLSASAEAPASPFSTSTLSTNSAVSNLATESLLAHSKQNNPRNHDLQNGRFARTVPSSLKRSEASSMYSDSSRSSKAASIALSSQASVGAGGCKVNKRRCRTNNKAPIAVLSADTSNFRAMVQQLTGIPSSSSIQSLTHGGIPVLNPQPIRQSFPNTLNLPTLDTSAGFLGPKNMKEGFSFAQRPHQLSSSSSAANLTRFTDVDLSRVEGRNVDHNTLQSHMPSHVSNQANGINQSLSSILLSRWDPSDTSKARGSFPSLHEGEQISNRQSTTATPATLDSLLMEEHSALRSSTNAVDSWLSFFEGAHGNHAPDMEIARMA